MKIIFRLILIAVISSLFVPLKAKSPGVVQLTLRLLEGNTLLVNQTVYIAQTERHSHPERGTIVFELPADKTFFTVEVPGKVIVLPEGGIVYVPKDPNHVITILLGSRKEQIAFSEINKQLAGLTNSVKDINEYIGKSRKLLENYMEQNNLILEQYKIEQFMEIQKEKQFRIEGQLKTIPLLTSNIDFYISRTKDLIDILNRNKEKVFNDNGKIIDEINKKIKAYNVAYENLNSNRETLISYVENYWGQSSLDNETRKLMDDALQNIHQLKLLISNNLIEDISSYNERKKKRRKKAEIISDINETTDKVRIMIENLDKDKTRIVQKMKEFYPPST